MLAAIVALMFVPASPPCCEVSLGSSGLLYYAAFSADPSISLDATARLPIDPSWGIAAGLNVALAPARLDGFGRLEVTPAIGIWRPVAGFELGLTSRGHYEDGSGIVGELARSSRRDLVPLYGAIVAAPLRFEITQRWTVSIAELRLGTHLDPAGRYVRLQLGFIMLGVTP
jgi:hypothetical protein